MARTMKRILVGILVLVGVLALLLAGSIVIDTALGRDRLEAVSNTTIPGTGGGPDVRVYVARPEETGPHPAVIMIHEFFGLNESIVGKAEGLAQEGYLVVAPDTFRGSTTSWIPRAIWQVITTRPENVNQDLDSVFSWLEAQPDVDPSRIGILGFCYGGRTSLTYSLNNDRLAATVVFYGSPETNPEILRRLPGPVLGIFGGSDRSIPLQQVRAFETALEQAGVPNEITVYEGQPHAFVRNIEGVRAGGVQGQAWAQMLEFLQQNLKVQSAAALRKPGAFYQEPFDWRYYARLAYEHTRGSTHPAH